MFRLIRSASGTSSWQRFPASQQTRGEPVRSPTHLISSYPLPLSPQSAALAGQAIAANPHNAAAILGQLINDPANRYAPAGYWFHAA